MNFLNKVKKKKKELIIFYFLSFDPRLSFLQVKFEHLNFNLTYDKIIKVLNKISNNKQFKICIKRKNKNPLLFQISYKNR